MNAEMIVDSEDVKEQLPLLLGAECSGSGLLGLIILHLDQSSRCYYQHAAF